MRTGGWRLAVKGLVVLAWMIGSYVTLVFWAHTWWLAALSLVSLSLAIAGFGFTVQHDGNHRASSGARWLNQLTGYGLDLVGGSSYFWKAKHNVAHHTYTNVTGIDDDIFMAGLARFSPHDRRLGFHRFQHLYIWVLYAFLLLKWHWVDDFRLLVQPRVGGRDIKPPRGFDLLGLLGGKALCFFFALGLPLMVRPWPEVLVFYVATVALVGLILGMVFQLAHCVEESDFPAPVSPSALPGAAPGGRLARDWAHHQVETTVDFAPGNRLLTWYLGGLNYQIEYHLFPTVSHVHYPALAPILREVCEAHGVTYACQPTMRAGLRSHYRQLRRLGREPVLAGA